MTEGLKVFHILNKWLTSWDIVFEAVRESMKSNYSGWSPLLLALMVGCCDASIVTPPPNCSDAHQLIKVARGHHTSSCNQGLCQDYKHGQIRSLSCST